MEPLPVRAVDLEAFTGQILHDGTNSVATNQTALLDPPESLMSPPSLPTAKARRLATLLAAGNYSSFAQLSKTLHISPTTIHKYRRRIHEKGYSFTAFCALNPGEMNQILRPRISRTPDPDRYISLTSVLPDVWDSVSSGKLNITESWKHYKASCPHGYGNGQFTAHFHKWQQERGIPTKLPSRWRITKVTDQDASELEKWRRSNNRIKWAKAVTILGLREGASLASLSSKFEKSPRTIKRWRDEYSQLGIGGLRYIQHRRQSPEAEGRIEARRDRMIGLLHEAPELHGINRASWSLKSLSRAYLAKYDESIGMSTVSGYLHALGYTFKRARKVLTSPDPAYREKLKEITGILSGLRANERFFSVDEFGPFSVKVQGGRTYSPKGVTRAVPQRQRSKGRLILTGALELSTNQLTHFYSEKKNTDEMIRLIELLLEKYSTQQSLYISWDAASWHISSRLSERVSELNSAAKYNRLPVVKLAPLPVFAQFLNVIESVFSGMAKAVLHNSNYQSVDKCKKAIDNYVAARNEYYTNNPKRAGDKIWGNELVLPTFNPSNICKDPEWR